MAIEIDSHQRNTRSGLSSPATIEELNRNSIHSVPLLSFYHQHPVTTAEQILTPAISSARMARKWTREQNGVIERAEKRCPKGMDQPPAPLLQPLIKTANVIRRVSYKSQTSNRLSFPR